MALSDLLSFAPKEKIGQMDIMASLEEIHVDTMQMTEHPVELGAAITDHAYARPKRGNDSLRMVELDAQFIGLDNLRSVRWGNVGIGLRVVGLRLSARVAG